MAAGGIFAFSYELWSASLSVNVIHSDPLSVAITKSIASLLGCIATVVILKSFTINKLYGTAFTSLLSLFWIYYFLTPLFVHP